MTAADTNHRTPAEAALAMMVLTHGYAWVLAELAENAKVDAAAEPDSTQWPVLVLRLTQAESVAEKIES